jgi:hypothetical protein
VQPGEYEGIWWLPDAPDNTIVGKLTFDQTDGLRLSAIGLLSNPLESQGRLEVFSFIFGRTTESQDVTLCRCAQVNWRFGTGVGTTVISAQFAFVGAHLASLDDARFRRAYAQFMHLPQWAGITGITQAVRLDDGGERISQFTQAFSFPPEPVGVVDDWEIRLVATSHITSDRYSKALIEQTISVRLDFPVPRGFEDIVRGVLHTVKDFLTLAVGAPTPSLGLTLERDDATHMRQSIEVLMRDPTQLLSSATIGPQEMVFTLPELSESWPEPLSRMFKARSTLRPVMDLYFAAVNNPGVYIEVKFLTVLQALEAFHRRTRDQRVLLPEHFTTVKSRVTELLATPDLNLSDEVRQIFGGRLAYWNELSLRRRLHDIVRSLRSDARRAIDDGDQFVHDVVEMRNYLTHYDSEEDQLASDLHGLVQLTGKAMFVLEQCLLQLIGVPAVVLDRHAQHARSQMASTRII